MYVVRLLEKKISVLIQKLFRKTQIESEVEQNNFPQNFHASSVNLLTRFVLKK